MKELALLLKEEQYRFFKKMNLEINREVQVITPELDPLMLLTTTYTHSKRQKIKDIFKTIKEMNLTEKSSIRDFYNFVVDARENPINKSESTKLEKDSIMYKSTSDLDNNSSIVLGTIELTTNTLILDAISTRRYDYLEKTLLKGIRQDITLANKNERPLEEKPTRGIKIFRTETYEEIAPLENFEELVAKQFEGWATKKNESLDNLSLEEASKENPDKYKEGITKLIKKYENTFLNLEKNFGIELDKSELGIIKKRIGLDVGNEEKQPVQKESTNEIKKNRTKATKKKNVSVEEQENNVRKIFKLGKNKELPNVTNKSLQIYYNYLQETINFPFTGMYYEEVGPFEDKEYKLSIMKIEPFGKLDEEFYGLLVQGIEGRRKMVVPLGDIEVKEEGPNRDVVEEYLTWFWNNR